MLYEGVPKANRVVRPRVRCTVGGITGFGTDPNVNDMAFYLSEREKSA
jgi:hypothetical protein